MPNASRIGDDHICPLAEGPKPHKGGPVLSGEVRILIGGMPAATVGSVCLCLGPPDQVVQGCPSVLLGGRPAARQGDHTAHGGTITQGCSSVSMG